MKTPSVYALIFLAGGIAGLIGGYAIKLLPSASVVAVRHSYGSGGGGPVSGSATKEFPPVTLDELLALSKDFNFYDLSDTLRYRRMLDVQDRLNVQDVVPLLNELDRLSPQPEHQTIRFQLATALAKKNPEQALAVVQTMKDVEQKNSAIDSITNSWANKDLEGILAWARTEKDTKLAAQATRNAYTILSGKDPESAIRRHFTEYGGEQSALKYEKYYTWALDAIFTQWIQKDPEAAVRRVVALPAGDRRTRLLLSIASQWAERDSTAAWRWASVFPENTQTRYGGVKSNVLCVWARKAPATALAESDKITRLSEKRETVTGIVLTWSRQDFKAALDWTAQNLDAELRSKILQKLSEGRETSKEDLAALLNVILSSMPFGQNYNRSMSNLFSKWASEDIPSAIQALDRLPQGRVYNNAALDISQEWAWNDPFAALAWVKKLPEEKLRNDILHQTGYRFAQKDPQAVLAAMSEFPPSYREKITINALENWAVTSPHEALAWAERLSDSKMRDSAICSVALRWLMDDPADVAAWTLTQPEGQLRANVVRNLTRQWAERDFAATAEWLKKLPSGSDLDAAIGIMASVLQENDPQGALAWAKQIGDERMRGMTENEIVHSWLDSSPVAAREWVINKSNFPQETKDRLLQDNN